MSLHRLVFDTTDSTSIADSANVGAYVRSSDGSLITSGDGASDNVANTFEGLDTRSFLFGYDAVGDNWDRLQQISGAMKVYIDGGDFDVGVALDGVYDAGTNTNPDNAGLIAHVRDAAPGDAQQTFRSTGGAASADDVVAANVHGLDVNAFGMVFDGTTWDRLRGTAGAINIHDGGNSITVDGSVSVANDPALANTDIATASTLLTAGGTEEPALASTLASRKYLYFYNNSKKTQYLGKDGSGVTSATGYPLPAGSALEAIRAGAAIEFEFISSETGSDLRSMQLS